MSNKFTINNPMPPEWMMYPHIPLGSIGWRMGYGEEYSIEHYDWFNSLNKENQKKYNEMFPKPAIWNQDNSYFRHNDYFGYFWRKDGKPEYSLSDLIADLDSKKIQKNDLNSKKIQTNDLDSKQINLNDLDFVFFWEHLPLDIDGELIETCLCQWYDLPFKVGNIEYGTMEQYMMDQKAKVFGDCEIQEKIMDSVDPETAKRLGREVKGFNRAIWDKVKYTIVLTGNYYKFAENKPLRDYLLSTSNKIIVEASPYDNIWGIAISKDEEIAKNPYKWKGKNLLGFALMELRNELKRVYKNYDKVDWNLINSIY